MIRCADVREAISARLDGEDPGLDPMVVADHLAGCTTCAAWEVSAREVTRAVRVHDADSVPDLTAAVLHSILVERAATAAPPSLIRLALALVAIAQAFIALPALVGDDLGATVHVAHEQAAWGLALAAALALAAWKPERAAAFLPLLAIFVGCLAVLATVDVIAGRVAPTSELPHVMAAVGVGLLWLEAHPGSLKVRVAR